MNDLNNTEENNQREFADNIKFVNMMAFMAVAPVEQKEASYQR